MTQATKEARKQEIREEAIEAIKCKILDMNKDDFCEIANDYGDDNTLYLTLGEMFEGENVAPIEAYEIGREYGQDIDECADFYRYNWGEVETFDRYEEAQDIDELAEALFDDEYFDDIMDEYNEALEELEQEAKEQERKAETVRRIVDYLELLQADEETDALTLEQVAGDIIDNTRVLELGINRR